MALHDALRGNHSQIAYYLTDHREATKVYDSPKEEQMDQVFQLMSKEGGFSFSLIAKEIDYYYNQLNLNWAYFNYFTPAQISNHIHAFIAAKKVAEIGGQGESISLSIKKEHSELFICTKPEWDKERS